jgi:hypothetical protein
MTETCNLKTGGKEKPVVTATYFIRLIEGLWRCYNNIPSRKMTQFLFNMKLMAYTAARPGTLVATQAYDSEAIMYKV